jgi:hypothetical protein
MPISHQAMEQISKYNWVKYQQLPEERLWLVIRLFKGEYAVYLYNSENDSHDRGVFFKNKRDAEYKYQRKLAYYTRGVTSNPTKSLSQKLAEEMGWEVIVD